MPIWLIQATSFGPETTRLLGFAHDRACERVGPEARVRKALPKRTIAAARRGERDIEKLIECRCASLIKDCSPAAQSSYFRIFWGSRPFARKRAGFRRCMCPLAQLVRAHAVGPAPLASTRQAAVAALLLRGRLESRLPGARTMLQGHRWLPDCVPTPSRSEH
jgi:hypothetical protein